MTLKLNGSSSGSISIDAPASTTGGADVALTLPVNDGDAGQVLQTDGSGNLTWVTPNTPNFSSYGTQSAGNAAWGDIICGTEYFDTDSAYNTSTGVFTVPAGKAGTYYFEAMIQVPNMGDTKSLSISLQKNGSNITAAMNHWYSSAAGLTMNATVTTLINLAATDTVKSQYWHNQGGSQTTLRQYFLGWRIT